jgi:hypothetical protein
MSAWRAPIRLHFSGSHSIGRATCVPEQRAKSSTKCQYFSLVKTIPLQADFVKEHEPSTISLNQAVGWHVLRNHRATCNERIRTNASVLMDGTKATQDRIISDRNMSSKRGDIREMNMIPDGAVVGNMRTRHEKVVVPNGGHSTSIFRPWL